MIDDEPHDPVIARHNIRPHRRADILSVVRVPGLPVHDADAAENPGSFSANRFDEPRLPESHGGLFC